MNAIIDEDDIGTTVATTIFTICLHLVLIFICVVKGKYKMALFGAFLPFVAFFGAVRLARPQSRWAKRRYHGEKEVKAAERAARHDDRYGPVTRRLSDFIGGKPSEPDPPPPTSPERAPAGQPAG